MEFSGYIDWKRLDAEAKLSNWSLTAELFKNHSLQKHFDSHDMVKTNSSDVKQDKETSKVVNAIPKIPDPRIPYPKRSDLSIQEQKYFLDTYKEYISGKEIGFENLNRLQSLMWKLSSEQEEFLRFLQQHSLSAKEDYNFLHRQVRKEIQKILEAWRCQAQRNLDPLYCTLFQTIGLSSGAVFPNDPILCHKRTLKHAVGQYLLCLPDVKTRRKSLLESNEPDTSWPTYCQISQDSCSCSLASENAAHFVLTAEALQTLIDNHPPEYEKEWELPITVTDQLKDSNKVTSDYLKTIMIDDPLPPKSVKPREANAMYYRRKVCDILRKPQENQRASSDVNNPGRMVGKNGELSETMDIGSDSTIEEDHLQTSSEIIQDLSKNVDMAFDMESKSGNEDQVKSRKLGSEEENSSNGNTDKDYDKPQFSYSLWTFGNLNLLIRTNDCGMLYQGSKAGKGSLHPVNVFVKPEYQLTYGYEQITTSEASRWWINTYINQSSLCICARVNPITSQLLQLDVLNQSNILTLSSFDPASPMKMIHGILTRLEKLLSPGKYILTHSAKDMHLCVYEVVEDGNSAQVKKASYDLHLSQSKDRLVLVDYETFVPWVPVDPNVFLDWHIAHHRIPLTFPPVSKEALKKIKDRGATGGMKKKKGKKTKNTQACTFKRKGNEGQMEIKPQIDLKTLSNQSNYPPGSEKQAENEEDIGISQRLRSRAKLVTYYDDIEFDL